MLLDFVLETITIVVIKKGSDIRSLNVAWTRRHFNNIPSGYIFRFLERLSERLALSIPFLKF